jgi:hypothetical protein
MPFDALEAAGHDLCHIAGPMAGVSQYYCEGCGALVQIREQAVILFHVPHGSLATEASCPYEPGEKRNPEGASSLKDKLKALSDADWERLRDR